VIGVVAAVIALVGVIYAAKQYKFMKKKQKLKDAASRISLMDPGPNVETR